MNRNKSGQTNEATGSDDQVLEFTKPVVVCVPEHQQSPETYGTWFEGVSLGRSDDGNKHIISTTRGVIEITTCQPIAIGNKDLVTRMRATLTHRLDNNAILTPQQIIDHGDEKSHQCKHQQCYMSSGEEYFPEQDEDLEIDGDSIGGTEYELDDEFSRPRVH